MGTNTQADAELVSAARLGSRAAAEELFARHWRSAWRTALAITGNRAAAEDVTQDALERAFRGLPRFDGRRPFSVWLHRIVVNRALTSLRTERRLVSLETIAEPASEDPESPDRGLLAIVAGLPPDRRVALILRYGLGHSLAEIAELTDVPVGTAQSRLARALAELRIQLEVGDAERP